MPKLEAAEATRKTKENPAATAKVKIYIYFDI